MITDNQVRKLMKYLQEGMTLALASAKAGMDEKTARKYRDLGELPSEIKAVRVRTWRTRRDPFEEVWEMVKSFLKNNPGLEAKTLFEHLQRQYPGRYADGQIRTFQGKVKLWRVTEGPGSEVFFPQVHKPGRLSQSDFTHMGSLGIRIGWEAFDHLIYHFVLTYSNWGTGAIWCFQSRDIDFSAKSRETRVAWKCTSCTLLKQPHSLTQRLRKKAIYRWKPAICGLYTPLAGV